MEATNITFLENTFHRDFNGGYEKWSFNVDNREFVLFCDLRIPGVIKSFYEKLPEDKSKVAVVDIIFTTKSNIPELYDPSQSTPEMQEAVSNAVIKILFEKIKPKRDFKYIAFVSTSINREFYRKIVYSVSTEIDNEIKEKVFRIINPDLQSQIDAGFWDFVVGQLG